MTNSSTSKRLLLFLNMDLELMQRIFVITALTASKQSRKWRRTSSRIKELVNIISFWWIAICRLWTDMNRLKKSENSCMLKTFISPSSLLSLAKQARRTSWNAFIVAWIKLLANHWNQMSSKTYLSIWTTSRTNDFCFGRIINNIIMFLKVKIF